MRLIQAYVAFARRHAGALTAFYLLVTLVALTQAVRLGLNTDMAELLPGEHPAVLALRRLNGRQRSSTNLVLLVSSPDAEATHKFKELLKPALETLLPKVFSSMQWEPSTQIHDHAKKWRWLYAEQSDLESASDLFDRVIAKRENPMAVDLEGDPDEELKAMRGRLEKKLPPPPRKAFEIDMDGRHYLGVILWKRGSGFATLDDAAALKAAHAVVDPLNASGVRVDWTGAIVMGIDESDAVRADLTTATTVCTLLVLLVIYLYFRRVAVLWVIGSPAIMGLVLVLGIARQSIVELNANTAFLLSIILGNGINAPIILLARFGEERRQGRPLDPRSGRTVEDSLVTALRSTILATGAAMAAASIAYGSLMATTLRGLNQFGLIGGAGMLLVWMCSLLLSPPMVFLGERWKPGLLTPPPPAAVWRLPFAWIGEKLERHPRAPLYVALGLTLAAAVPLSHWLHDPYEWDLEKLRTSDTTAQKRWSRMYDVIGGGEIAGYIATDGIILVDTPQEADAIAEALRQKDALLGKHNVLRTVRTLHSILPKDQPEKLAILAKLRRQLDKHAELMSPEERKEADEWRPPDYLRVLTVDDLPERILTAFTEVDGTRGRLVGIDVEFTHASDKNGHDLLRIAEAMQVDALGRHWVAASAPGVFAGMLQVILKDGPKVTAVAFVGVLVLLALAFGWGALPVMLSLGIGVTWLGGIVAVTGQHINFLNFVALPITLGVAADYGANIWVRLGRDGAIRSAIAETGSAVALCSATTVIGYSSLLLAHNGALRSFGIVADIGEVTCLWAAFLVLPAVARRRKTVAPPGEATGS